MTRLIVLFSSTEMAERKAVIKNADMSEDMQQDAVDCASQALEKYNIEKVFLHIGLLSPHSSDPVSTRTLPPTSRRSSIKNTIQHGTALLAEILDHMSPMRQSTLSIFILDK